MQVDLVLNHLIEKYVQGYSVAYNWPLCVEEFFENIQD